MDHSFLHGPSTVRGKLTLFMILLMGNVGNRLALDQQGVKIFGVLQYILPVVKVLDACSSVDGPTFPIAGRIALISSPEIVAGIKQWRRVLCAVAAF